MEHSQFIEDFGLRNFSLSKKATMVQKGKARADRHSIRLYDKDYNSLQIKNSKITALAAALEEAEAEIEDLENRLKERIESNCG